MSSLPDKVDSREVGLVAGLNLSTALLLGLGLGFLAAVRRD